MASLADHLDSRGDTDTADLARRLAGLELEPVFERYDVVTLGLTCTHGDNCPARPGVVC